MRGFGSFAFAARVCPALEEQHQYFRIPNHSGVPVSLPEHRHRFQERWAVAMAERASA